MSRWAKCQNGAKNKFLARIDVPFDPHSALWPWNCVIIFIVVPIPLWSWTPTHSLLIVWHPQTCQLGDPDHPPSPSPPSPRWSDDDIYEQPDHPLHNWDPYFTQSDAVVIKARLFLDTFILGWKFVFFPALIGQKTFDFRQFGFSLAISGQFYCSSTYWPRSICIFPAVPFK